MGSGPYPATQHGVLWVKKRFKASKNSGAGNVSLVFEIELFGVGVSRPADVERLNLFFKQGRR